ncbi:MAG: hypothetical protein J1F60_02110 [Oscillospiraceae bacterium]|nr:hypothetical protein [Oscillospiraceae bacterium]
MKTKKLFLIITAICCILMMSACNKNQDDTSVVSKGTTATRATENKGEATVIDVFSDLNVTFEGENGSGKIICEYTGNNDFIKYDVEFKGDRNGSYKNGDTAVVKLDYSDYRAENANVFFKEKEHEYTVEGLWGVILSPDGYDFSECNQALEERMFDKERSDSMSNIRDFDIGNIITTTYIDGESDPTDWKILSAEYEAIRGKLIITDSCKNEYTVFYKVTLLCEKIEGSFFINPDSKYAVGDKKEWKFVIGETTRNVFVEKDSNIVKTDPEAITTGGGKIMSQTTIYSSSETEYNDNFDEYYGKMIYINPDKEIFDVEI